MTFNGIGTDLTHVSWTDRFHYLTLSTIFFLKLKLFSIQPTKTNKQKISVEAQYSVAVAMVMFSEDAVT